MAVPALAAIPLLAIEPDASAATCNGVNNVSCGSTNIEFQVNIKEVLKVSLNAPTTKNSGTTGSLLRHRVVLNVTSNNPAGYLAYMTTSGSSTDLVNTSNNTAVIPTLDKSYTASAFPANYWGYSTNDTEAGSTSANYYAMVNSTATPITIASSSVAANSGDKNIFFGAKADASKPSGTYEGTVVFTVVSGVHDNSSIPNDAKNNPATPTTNTVVAENGSYTSGYSASNYNGGSTTYTKVTSSTDAVSGTTNKRLSYVYSGDTLSAVTPQGVTTSSVGEGTPLAIGLAVTAAVAASAGIIFFIIAKRKKEDEEEDEDW